RGIEIGNIFQLGTKYTAALGATFGDVNGRPQPIVMGSYGIGVGRMLACLVEEYADENGIRLPISVAPYHVHLTGLMDNEESISVADQLYADLKAAGVEVIYDNRGKKSASPGVKFRDADLIGIPIRLTVAKRALGQGGVEYKLRHADGREIVPLDQVIDTVKAEIERQFGEIAGQVAQVETWPK
ncbi:MAG: His/Gly/Thr/Pro-type tRNA ligase C-terminal domain-containing protein, partial [Bacteroidota bacterium]